MIDKSSRYFALQTHKQGKEQKYKEIEPGVWIKTN